MNKFYVAFGIAVFIIGFVYLAFMVGALVGHERDYDAFEVKAKVDVRRLGSAVDLYQQDHGNYPGSLDVLVGDYLKEITRDPWGNDFGYISDGSKAIIFTNGGSNRKSKQIFHVERKNI